MIIPPSLNQSLVPRHCYLLLLLLQRRRNLKGNIRVSSLARGRIVCRGNFRSSPSPHLSPAAAKRTLNFPVPFSSKFTAKKKTMSRGEMTLCFLSLLPLLGGGREIERPDIKGKLNLSLQLFSPLFF